MKSIFNIVGIPLVISAILNGCAVPPPPGQPTSLGFTRIVKDIASHNYVFCRGCEESIPTKKTPPAQAVTIDPLLLKKAIVDRIQSAKPKAPDAVSADKAAVAYSLKQLEELRQECSASGMSTARRQRIEARLDGIEAQDETNHAVLIITSHIAANRFTPTEELERVLIPAAKMADHITVRGYTSLLKDNGKKTAVVRAVAVRNYLVAHGIERKAITTESVPAAAFIADNATPQGQTKNRRVEITLQFPTSPNH